MNAGLSPSSHGARPMTKAPPSLHQPIPASMLVTLARYRAKQAVLEQYRAQGLRPWWDCEANDITKAANQYLKDHPELFAQAAESVRNDPRLRTLAARQVREIRRSQRCPS